MNGRINIMNIPGKKTYSLFQQINNGNKKFKGEAIQHIHTKNDLNQIFFSKQNMNIIQDLIRCRVYKESNKKHIIGRQSDLQLKIIMRSIYFQYAKNNPNNIKEQITVLNNKIIDYSVKEILSNIKQYLSYKKAVSTIPEPLDRPKNLNSAGTKSLQPKFGF